MKAYYEDACTEHIIDNVAQKSGQAVPPNNLNISMTKPVFLARNEVPEQEGKASMFCFHQDVPRSVWGSRCQSGRGEDLPLPKNAGADRHKPGSRFRDSSHSRKRGRRVKGKQLEMLERLEAEA